ncbi:hypothetical protein ABN238_19225 [Providencia rettgeri]|uniref:hypothetical protein n=1 Tax=Providencia rettgeri TaxID=587 RepID=UPI0032DAEC17
MIFDFNVKDIVSITDVNYINKYTKEVLENLGSSVILSGNNLGFIDDPINVINCSTFIDSEHIIQRIIILYTETDPAYCCPMISSGISRSCYGVLTIYKSQNKAEFNIID